MNHASRSWPAVVGAIGLFLAQPVSPVFAAETHKPVLHARHWVAVTGKPLGATAGARMFERGGNAVDAACAMLAVVCTMFDDVSWGGETQALVYDPRAGRVVGVNALGVAPTGATAGFFKSRGLAYPPDEGPLAAVTPGNPGGLMVLLAEYGTLSLGEVLGPALEMADGYPMDAETARKLERFAAKHRQWPYSKMVLLPHPGRTQEWPAPGELFRQPDLLGTLRKLVEAESGALKAGLDRKAAIRAAYDRFYRGDIAAEFVRGVQEQGGLITLADLAEWRVRLEEPVRTTYRGVEVCKLTCWTQGPAMLQALNLLEPLDLRGMGYDSARYIHTVYQAMNLAFADRDFYYGDPYLPPEEPIRGLLSKAYAQDRWRTFNLHRNDPDVRPGDPYPYEGGVNPFLGFLTNWSNLRTNRQAAPGPSATPVPPAGTASLQDLDEEFRMGTTSIQAADEHGWAISVTPSGGWLPACVAGRTGVALSQRMQSFVLEEAENPFNVVRPGQRPRVTLTPTLALKEGKPWLCFSVQGGDTQDQNLLQFLLNVVDFGMTVQEACEAANFTSYQMRSSFGRHEVQPGRLTLSEKVPDWVRDELRSMGYVLDFQRRTSGPITAIWFDQEHGTLWGGASDHGDDYGIAW